jgi:hypothetical protein
LKKQRKFLWVREKFKRIRQKGKKIKGLVRNIKGFVQTLVLKNSDRVKRHYQISKCGNYIKIFKFVKSKTKKWICTVVYILVIIVQGWVNNVPQASALDLDTSRSTPLEIVNRANTQQADLAIFDPASFSQLSETFNSKVGNDGSWLLPGSHGYSTNPNSRPGGSSGPGRSQNPGIGGSKNSGISGLGSSKPDRAPSGFFRMSSTPGFNGQGGGKGGGNGGGNGGVNQPWQINQAKRQSDNTCAPSSQSRAQKKAAKKERESLTEAEVIKTYEKFLNDMEAKGYENIDISQERFCDLCKNRQTGYWDEKSVTETIGGLQRELNGTIKNLRRPENPKIDLDFVAERVATGETIWVDLKTMEDLNVIAEAKGIDIKNFPSHQQIAFNMGCDCMDQKDRFLGLPNGPTSAAQVEHVFNFGQIRNVAERAELVQAVLDGLKSKGYDMPEGIYFINYE